jgi:type 1 glutamine amidotransferase
MRISWRAWIAVGLVMSLWLARTARADEKIRLLIVDGQNNHDWRAMTPLIRAVLEGTGRFTVDVATSPDRSGSEDEWNAFRPRFSNCDAVLSNYNGQPWPDSVQRSLETYVSDGGGLVVIHAANNAFTDWPAWNDMIGLGWRPNTFGDRLTIDDSGKVVRTPKGQGPSSGHGPQHPFKVVVRDSEHPVTKGMPTEWMHAKDELYHGQRGPAQGMKILATAYSSVDMKGTGTNEPMIWVIPYRKGRVFTTLMGHVGGGQNDAIRCVGFETVMCRGAEWAATGRVTIPIPANFPTADAVSLDERLGKGVADPKAK